MMRYIFAALFLLLNLSLIAACGGNSNSGDGSFLHQYQFSLSSYEVVETEEGLLLRLSGISPQIAYQSEQTDGDEVATVELESGSFLSWLAHPAIEGHSAAGFDEIVLSSQEGEEVYEPVLPVRSSYNPERNEFSLLVTSRTENRLQKGQSKRSVFDAIAKAINSTASHPSVCGVLPPGDIQGLQFKLVDDYDLKWNDRGSGARLDVSVWRPLPAEGYFSLGDLAIPSYSTPHDVGCYTVAVLPDDESRSVMRRPIDYSRVWRDRGSGAHRDGSFWRAIAPQGYECMGDLGQLGYSKPSLESLICVQRDLVEVVEPGKLIWNDRMSGAQQDVSLYSIPGLGYFSSQGSYQTPNSGSGNYYKFRE